MDSSLREGRTPGRRTPLTQRQKKYRRENGLCMYCGDSEHKVTECSKLPMERATVTGSTNPENLVSPKKLDRPIGGIVATPQDSAPTSTAVGSLTLPRELRNRIYEELLSVDEFQVQQFADWRKLEPKILSVNRQIHHEASQTLYDENGWVTLTAEKWAVESMVHDRVESLAGFPGGSEPVKRYPNDRLSGSAIVHMRLEEGSNSTEETVNLVIHMSAMARFCRLLTQSLWVSEVDLVLCFRPHAKTSRQNRLLASLSQARGLRRVTILGTERSWPVVNTVHTMTSPYTKLVHVLNTVWAFQYNSERELQHGRSLAARNLLLEGADFVDWCLDKIIPLIESATSDEEEMDELLQARADMGFSCASLCVRLGSIDPAQRAIKLVLHRLSRTNRLRGSHEARAHFHMAQTFEAVGWKNAALYSYLQALQMRPGFQDADVAVDQMETNLASGMALEELKLKHNLHHVLRPFRHQPTNSPVVSNAYYERIFQEFDGTAPDIRSVDRSASTRTTNLPSSVVVILEAESPILGVQVYKVRLCVVRRMYGERP